MIIGFILGIFFVTVLLWTLFINKEVKRMENIETKIDKLEKRIEKLEDKNEIQ